jgi:putative NIF3 family GTP cyclohydrolase 1 type 2
MISPSELERIIFEIAPQDLAEEWDNVGLLIDCGNKTDRILFSLDASVDAIEEAEELGCNIIVTHHPVIFHPLKRIVYGSAVETAIRKGISIISAHTNFDSAENGMNDILCGLLGLEDIIKSGHMFRIGIVPGSPVPLSAFSSFVKEKLTLSYV